MWLKHSSLLRRCLRPALPFCFTITRECSTLSAPHEEAGVLEEGKNWKKCKILIVQHWAHLQRVSYSLTVICCICKLANSEDNSGLWIPALSIINVNQTHITKQKTFYLCIMSDDESDFCKLKRWNTKPLANSTPAPPVFYYITYQTEIQWSKLSCWKTYAAFRTSMKPLLYGTLLPVHLYPAE